VSVPLANRPRNIGVFCGSKRPPKLMSNDVNLDVTFVSHATSSTSAAKGFTAVYSFVTGERVHTWFKALNLWIVEYIWHYLVLNYSSDVFLIAVLLVTKTLLNTLFFSGYSWRLKNCGPLEFEILVGGPQSGKLWEPLIITLMHADVITLNRIGQQLVGYSQIPLQRLPHDFSITFSWLSRKIIAIALYIWIMSEQW